MDFFLMIWDRNRQEWTGSHSGKNYRAEMERPGILKTNLIKLTDIVTGHVATLRSQADPSGPPPFVPETWATRTTNGLRILAAMPADAPGSRGLLVALEREGAAPAAEGDALTMFAVGAAADFVEALNRQRPATPQELRDPGRRTALIRWRRNAAARARVLADWYAMAARDFENDARTLSEEGNTYGE